MRVIRQMVLCCVVLSGCSMGEPPLDSWQLATGAPLTSLASPESLTVVLIIDPADCLSCFSVISSWLQWQRENPTRFRLVLSRAPDPWEDHTMKMLRINVDDSLSSGKRLSPDRLPVELILSRNEIVYVDSLVHGRVTSRLLDDLRTGMTVTEFVQLGRQETEDPVAAGHHSMEERP